MTVLCVDNRILIAPPLGYRAFYQNAVQSDMEDAGKTDVPSYYPKVIYLC